MSTKISVIIPCYNQGRYLDEAIQSVLAQTLQDFEIIVVDDGSTDAETIDLLNHLNYRDTTLFRTPHSGVSAARNFAIQNSHGTYILPLDADDKIAPDYLKKAVDILEQDSSVGIVYSRAEYFGARTGAWDLPDFSWKKFVNSNCIFISAVFRRSSYNRVGGFPAGMILFEDWDFWMSLLESGEKIVRIPETMFFYRRHPGSVIARKNHRMYAFYAQQLVLRHLHTYWKYRKVLCGSMKETFFSRPVKKAVCKAYGDKERWKYLFSFVLYRIAEVIKAYLLFPVYCMKMYKFLKD